MSAQRGRSRNQKRANKPKKNDKKKSAKIACDPNDRHLLYTAAVQSTEADLDFFIKVYKKKNGRVFEDLREDFCGTAVLACEWVQRKPNQRAWGVDLDQETLDWANQRYIPVLGDAAERLKLIRDDVLDVHDPKVDVVAGLSFSYSVFKTRDLLRRYFEQVRASLNLGGILFLDAFGGMEAVSELNEKRKIDPTTAFDGTKVPSFTYFWEQERFNPVDHQIVCHISFKMRGGRKIERAFSYDWRLWTLPELQELMIEAGFSSTEVYVDGWDDKEDEADGVFRRKKYFENQDGWIVYVLGLT